VVVTQRLQPNAVTLKGNWGKLNHFWPIQQRVRCANRLLRDLRIDDLAKFL
jgi:hypothetical protein